MNEVKEVTTALAPIQEQQKSQLIVYVETQIPAVEAMENRIEITNEKELGEIVIEGKSINRTAKIIEQIRVTAKAPWLTGGQMVDEAVRGILLRFKHAATKGKRLINTYQDKIAAEERAEEAKRQAAALAEEERRRKLRAIAEEKGQNVRPDITPVPPPDPVAHLAHRTPASSTTRWTAKVVDESQVPREYLAVDTVKINNTVREWRRQVKAAKAAGTEPPAVLVISGVLIEEVKDVTY